MLVFSKGSCTRNRTRTCDLRFRKPALYPTELRGRVNALLELGGRTTRVVGGGFDWPARMCVIKGSADWGAGQAIQAAGTVGGREVDRVAGGKWGLCFARAWGLCFNHLFPSPGRLEPPVMTSDLLKHTTVETVDVVELILPDDLDSSEFDRLNDMVAELIRPSAGRRWVIDLGRVPYLPSAGLGLLVNMRHHIRTQKGQIVLCGLSPRLLSVFRACSLERLFTIHRSREDAVRAVR